MFLTDNPSDNQLVVEAAEGCDLLILASDESLKIKI
jgi:hypothetical protein